MEKFEKEATGGGREFKPGRSLIITRGSRH